MLNRTLALVLLVLAVPPGCTSELEQPGASSAQSSSSLASVDTAQSTQPFCEIVLPACPNHSGLVGTFKDSLPEAHTTQSRCMNRAYEYYRYCTDNTNLAIGRVTTRFRQNSSTLMETRFPSNQGVCAVRIDSCANHPEQNLPLFFFDPHLPAHETAVECSARAASYSNYCNTVATTIFYSFVSGNPVAGPVTQYPHAVSTDLFNPTSLPGTTGCQVFGVPSGTTVTAANWSCPKSSNTVAQLQSILDRIAPGKHYECQDPGGGSGVFYCYPGVSCSKSATTYSLVPELPDTEIRCSDFPNLNPVAEARLLKTSISSCSPLTSPNGLRAYQCY